MNNNKIMWYLLLLLSFTHGFLNNNLRVTKSNLNMILDSNFHPSELVKGLLKEPLGKEWSYSELIEEIQKKNVEGLSLTESGNGALAIDSEGVKTITDIHGTNIHAVKLLPQTYNSLVDYLTTQHVNFDVFEIPHSQVNNILSMVSQGFITVGIYVAFAVCINIIINILRNRGPGGFPGMPGGNPNFPISNDQKRPGIPGGMSGGFWENDEPSTGPFKITTFDDVAGCEEAKFELMEVVDFLKNAEKYESAGAKIPKGVLLEGSPGTGKTLMAKAVAGEAGVPFISASGSEFIEMYVGLGAKRVRELFAQAKKLSPCVVFIDEIDAVGRQRGTGIAGGNDEREQTLNQILTNMDGFTESTGIVVLAATNRADILDNALTRPGRFDRKVKVPLPDKDGRKAISQVHFRNKKVGKDVDLDELAVLTSGFSGAEIANLANEAAIFQVRENKKEISSDILYKAYEKVTIGLPSNVQVKDENIIELVSNHEIGHALMASLFPEFFDLRKVTINENKNGMGGYTLFTPKDRYLKYATKKYLLANLIVALGGRAAEVYLYRKKEKFDEFQNFVFGEFPDLDITTGASNDLLQANKIAKSYITQYGFGNEFGQYDESITSTQPFIGRDLGMSSKGVSEYTRKELDNEVARLVKFAYIKALELIEINKDAYIELVKLIERKRIINGNEVNDVVKKYKKNILEEIIDTNDTSDTST